MWSLTNRFLRDQTKPSSEKAFSYLRTKDTPWMIAWIRRLIAAGVLYNFFVLPHLQNLPWSPSRRTQAAIALMYALYATFRTVAYRKKWLAPFRKLGRRHYWTIGTDVATFSMLLILSFNSNSDLYLLFALPMLIAADRLEQKRSLVAFFLIVTTYMAAYTPVMCIEMAAGKPFSNQLLAGTLPRATFFMMMSFITFFLLRLNRDDLYAKNFQLDAINSTAASIAHGENLQRRLKELMRAATSLLSARGCTVYLLERERLKVVALTGLEHDRFKIGKTLSLDEGIAGWVARNGKPRIVSNYPESLDASPELKDVFGSTAEVPLFNNKVLIGVLVVFDDPKERLFTEKDVEILQLLAQHAAVAISNALERLQQEALKRLTEAGDAIGSSLRTKTTLEAAVKHASHITAAYGSEPLFCDIWLSDGNVLNFGAGYSSGRPEIPEDKEMNINLYGSEKIGVVGRVALTGQEEIVERLETDPDYICNNPNTGTVLALPIENRMGFVGVLGIEHPEKDAFPEPLVDNLKIFASQVGAAVNNALLYERLGRLNAGGVRINAARGRNEVADRILDQLSIMFPFDRAVLFLIEGDNRLALLKRGDFPVGTDLNLERSISKDPLTSRILKENMACVATPSEIPEWEERDLTDDIKLWSGIPLKYRGEDIGFLTADRLTPAIPYEYQAEFLGILGTYAASSLQNVLLHEERQQQVEELKVLTETLADQSNLALIGLVYGETIHYARAKLGMARTIAADISQGRFDGDLDRLKEEAVRIKQLLRDYLEALKRIQEEAVAAPELVATDVHRTLERVLGAKRIAKREIHLVRQLAAPEPIVHAPERQLTQVFLVIIENALTAMRNNGTLTLSTRTLHGSAGEILEVAISDDGPGIPESKKRDLFKRKLGKGRGGTGIGLMWSYAFMRSYGGTIECESKVGVGTTMRVKIPRDFRVAKKDVYMDVQELNGRELMDESAGKELSVDVT